MNGLSCSGFCFSRRWPRHRNGWDGVPPGAPPTPWGRAQNGVLRGAGGDYGRTADSGQDRARGLAVVALLDQSRSIAPDQRSWMQAQVDRLRGMMGPQDRLAVVAFGRNAQLSAALDNPRVVQPEPVKVDAGATDIAGALTAGSVIFPPESEKKILLLSDGNETQGDALGVVPALVEQGIQVFTAPPPATARKRIAISSFEAPNPVRAHLNFALQIAIESDADAPVQAHLELRRDQATVTRLPVRLLPGLNRFELPYHLDEPGAYVLTAELSADNGLEVVNGRADATASVIATPRILVVSADRPMSLVSALKLRDYRVDVTTPERLPRRAEDYLGYQAVILTDVSARGADRRGAARAEPVCWRLWRRSDCDRRNPARGEFQENSAGKRATDQVRPAAAAAQPRTAGHLPVHRSLQFDEL